MEYRQLGRTGVQVSALCLGCMNFGWGTDEAESGATINTAVDAGINFLDTANVYGDTKGASEEIVGKVLSAGGLRSKVFLATKVHGRMDPDDRNAGGNSRYHIRQACDDSLRRLKTDHIDLYQIHRPQPEIPIDETLSALDDLVRAGKVLYIGTSTFAAWQLMEAQWAAKEMGTARFVCEQPPYNMLDRRVERELLPFCQSYGIGVIPWSPLAGGILTGKYRSGTTVPSGARYEKGLPEQRGTPAALAIVDNVVTAAKARGCTASAYALAWVLANKNVSSVIIGPSSGAQLTDNLEAVKVKFTPEELAVVDTWIKPGYAVAEYYDANFGPNARW